jgi:hypothetical protein
MSAITRRLSRWPLWAVSGLLGLFAISLFAVPPGADRGRNWQAQAASPEASASETPPAPESFGPDIPILESAPSGVFNGVRAQLLARRERFRELNRQIEEQSEQLEQLRHGGHPPMGALPEVRDRLAALHTAVDQMVQERDSARQFFHDTIVPNLGPMLAEVRTELARVGPDDPRRPRLEATERLLQAWQANPDLIEQALEHGRGPESPSRLGPVGEGPFPGWRLWRRLQRLEEQQDRLQSEVERLGDEIRETRDFLNRLSPEDVQQMEQRFPPERRGPPGAGDNRPRPRGQDVRPGPGS